MKNTKMAKKLSLALVIAMVAAAAMLHGSAAQTTHVVGDTTGWTIPTGNAATYSNWASQKTFTVGDVLVFRFTAGAHDAAEVSRPAFDGCNSANPISQSNTSPTNITLRTAGQHYYICTFSGHCGLGQKLAINVSAASTAPAPQPSATTPRSATPAPVPSRAPASAPVPSPPVATPAPSPSGGAAQTFTVGDRLGWTVPSGGSNTYQNWARNKNFRVGDTLVFNFANGAHNVATVSKSSFDSCNVSSPIRTITTSPARITLNNPGEHFYICTFPSHCSLGQKLAINVTGTASTPSSVPAPATPPSTSTPPPRSIADTPSGSTVPSAESPATPPPPPSAAAPPINVAALPVTLLSAALAFLY